MRKSLFYVANSVIVITVIVVVLIFLHIFRLPFIYFNLLGANNSLTHWIGWAGTLYIAFATPAYFLVKHKLVSHLKNAFNVHVIGNLVAVLLVSIHFAHQVTRSVSNYPELGTGVVLYATMIFLVSSGFLQSFSLMPKYAKQLRFIHPAFALTFYTVIVMHIIHGI
jgi:hypothetical protein